MAASLTKLKGFIQTYGGYNFDSLTEPELNDLQIFISEALAAVRWEIEEEFDGYVDPSSKSRYVFSLQSQLTHMADGITGFQNQDETQHAVLPVIFEWLLESVFQLLEHLHLHYKDHFNMEATLPRGFHMLRHQPSRVPLLRENLIKFNVESGLAALIINYLQATENTERFKVSTWRNLEFYNRIVLALENLFELPTIADINLELLKLFISQEFNSIQVYAYFVKHIEQFTAENASYEEQQSDLLYLLKIFRQVRIESAFLYDPAIQSLKASVLESIGAELNFLEQKNRIYQESFRVSGSSVPSKFYFSIASTLAELMFLCRVFLEVGFMRTKFKSYLYEFIQNHIKPDDDEQYSTKSMRNLFSNKPFPLKLVRNIRGWLVKMIDHIDLYYNF